MVDPVSMELPQQPATAHPDARHHEAGLGFHATPDILAERRGPEPDDVSEYGADPPWI